MLNNHVTSKTEIAKELNLSMPTVLANVNDLLEKMVLEETGEYASTGGRKAKSIGINKSYCHAMGILITANHIEMVLVNLGGNVMNKNHGKQENIRLGTHGEDYGSWMSNPVFYIIGGIGVLAAVLAVLSFYVLHVAVLGVLFP